MVKTLLFYIVLTFLGVRAFPQKMNSIVKGLLSDKDTQQPLADATVTLLYGKDSSSAVTGFTDRKGIFILKGVKAGAYSLYITFLGHQAILYPVELTTADTLVDLGLLSMQRTGVDLRLVEIVQIRTPVVVKKDTLEFNADYYKTRENAVMEELLKKIPGIQIDRDGIIKVDGETVKNILVNGKPFFGNDPKLATRNLPADMIDKIQLIDRNQAPYAGISEDKTEKAINITIKKDKKGSVLGRLSAGYGTGERFAANGNLNRLGDEEQLAFVGGGNNVNNSGILEGSGQGTGGIGNGITRHWNGGANYSRDFSKKLKVSASYAMNDNNTENERKSARQNLLSDTTYYYNQVAYSLDNNTTHNLDMLVEYKPDSLFTVITGTNSSYTNTGSSQEHIYESLTGNQQLVNKGTINNTNTGDALSLSSYISFEKKFGKAGRMLTTFLGYGINNTDRAGFNRSNNLFIQPSGEDYIDTIDQRYYIDSRYCHFSLVAIYAEPIFKDHFLELRYAYIRNTGISGKCTFNYNISKRAYDQLNDSLSNAFENIFAYHVTGVKLRAQGSKYDYGIGLYVQSSELDNYNISSRNRLQKHAANILPVASFSYAFTNDHRFRFFYNGTVQRPSMEQLQPVPNNNNPLYIQQGNPDLKPAFNHSINMGYNGLNSTTMHIFSINLNAIFIHNKIINASWFDSLGRQASQPLNVNGTYNINSSIANNFPLKKQRTAINTITDLAFSREVNYVNKIKRSIRNLNITQGLNFNYIYKELFELSLAASANFNGVRYTLQKDNNVNFLNYTFSLICSINLLEGFIMGGNLNYLLNTGRPAGYNQDIMMLNTFISKTTGRRRQGLIKLQGLNLLNRNLSISRNVGENFIEDVQVKGLQRSFLLSFMWLLKPIDIK